MVWLRVAVEAQNNFHKTAGFDKRLFILFIQYLQNKKIKYDGYTVAIWIQRSQKQSYQSLFVSVSTTKLLILII